MQSYQMKNINIIFSTEFHVQYMGYNAFHKHMFIFKDKFTIAVKLLQILINEQQERLSLTQDKYVFEMKGVKVMWIKSILL